MPVGPCPGQRIRSPLASACAAGTVTIVDDGVANDRERSSTPAAPEVAGRQPEMLAALGVLAVARAAPSRRTVLPARRRSRCAPGPGSWQPAGTRPRRSTSCAPRSSSTRPPASRSRRTLPLGARGGRTARSTDRCGSAIAHQGKGAVFLARRRTVGDEGGPFPGPAGRATTSRRADGNGPAHRRPGRRRTNEPTGRGRPFHEPAHGGFPSPADLPPLERRVSHGAHPSLGIERCRPGRRRPVVPLNHVVA